MFDIGGASSTYIIDGPLGHARRIHMRHLVEANHGLNERPCCPGEELHAARHHLNQDIVHPTVPLSKPEKAVEIVEKNLVEAVLYSKVDEYARLVANEHHGGERCGSFYLGADVIA